MCNAFDCIVKCLTAFKYTYHFLNLFLRYVFVNYFKYINTCSNLK